jgi:hypothetical protein
MGGSMPKITFVAPDGTGHAVDAEVGDSVMNAAVQNGVGGNRRRVRRALQLRDLSRVGARGLRGRRGHAR